MKPPKLVLTGNQIHYLQGAATAILAATPKTWGPDEFRLAKRMATIFREMIGDVQPHYCVEIEVAGETP